MLGEVFGALLADVFYAEAVDEAPEGLVFTFFN